MIKLLIEIRDCLFRIENKLDDINGQGLYSMEDIVEKLDNIDTVCDGDTKKVTNLIIRVLEELKKLENKNASSKRRKTNAR